MGLNIMESQEHRPLYGLHEFDSSKRSWCFRCGETEANVIEYKIYPCRRRRTPEEAQASMKRYTDVQSEAPIG